MDTILHAERGASGGRETWLTRDEVAALPDGSAVADRDAELCPAWRHAACPGHTKAYGTPVAIDRMAARLRLLTPPATIAAIRAGLSAPQVHASAEA